MRVLGYTKFCSKNNTYEVRGLCMLLILFHHIYVQLIQMGCCIPYVSILLSPGGYLGTGLFFFMSGYGLYHSMAFKEILPASYLWKRLLKMWSVFIVAYMLTSIPMMLNNEFGGGNLIDFLTLTIPHTTTWFFKVIVLTYIVTFLIFKLNVNRGWKVGMVTFVSVIYYVISSKFLPDFWYTSVLCFPMGMIVALCKSRLNTKLQLLLSMLFVPCFWKMQDLHWRFVTAILFCFFVLFLIRFVRYKSSVLNYIGVNSLCFYLFQLALLQNLHMLTSNPLVYMLLMVGCVFIFTFMYVKWLQPISNKIIN